MTQPGQTSAGCKAEAVPWRCRRGRGGSQQAPELSLPLPLQWCEKHKRSGRQTLGDLLIKPHQRVTKYPLLLQAVLKRSPEPQAQEALNAMVGTQVRLPPLWGRRRPEVGGGAIRTLSRDP